MCCTIVRAHANLSISDLQHQSGWDRDIAALQGAWPHFRTKDDSLLDNTWTPLNAIQLL